MVTYVAAAGFGDILSVWLRKMELISQLFSILVVPLFIACGFLAAVKRMVFYFIGLSYISFFKFSFQSAVIIEYPPERVALYLNMCTIKPQGCSAAECSVKIPNSPFCDPFKVYDFIETSYGVNIAFLAGLAIIFRVIAALIWCKFTADTPIPYEPYPALETFRGDVPKSKHSNISGSNKVHPFDASQFPALNQISGDPNSIGKTLAIDDTQSPEGEALKIPERPRATQQ